MRCWGGSMGLAGTWGRFRLCGSLLLAFSPRLLTREPISASCDVSIFSTRSWIETFNSFCTGRGTQNVQAWKKIHKFWGFGVSPWILFIASDLQLSLKKEEEEKKERFLALLTAKLIFFISANTKPSWATCAEMGFLSLVTLGPWNNKLPRLDVGPFCWSLQRQPASTPGALWHFPAQSRITKELCAIAFQLFMIWTEQDGDEEPFRHSPWPKWHSCTPSSQQVLPRSAWSSLSSRSHVGRALICFSASKPLSTWTSAGLKIR